MSNIQKQAVMDGESVESTLTQVDHQASVLEGSRLMRNCGTNELLVVDKSRRGHFTFSVLTANDIVTRVVAAGLDPTVMTMGDIAWRGAAIADGAAGNGGRSALPV